MPKINGSGQGSVFSRKELDKFFKVIKSENLYFYTLYKFLYFTGERSGCVIQVKWNDIDLTRDIIIFRDETRKGKYHRDPLDIHPELRQVLTDTIKAMRDKFGVADFVKMEYVFYGLRNEGDHISRSHLDNSFKKHLLKCGFENKGFSLHSFRRTFVTRLYEVNKNVKECMTITGHKNVTHFMTYIQVNPENIKEAIYSL